MLHRIAEIHFNDLPSVPLKLMHDDPAEVLVIHSIVRAKGSGIIVEDDCLVLMVGVIVAEVLEYNNSAPTRSYVVRGGHGFHG